MRWCLMTSVRTADRQKETIELLNHDGDALPAVNPEPVIPQGPSVYTGPTGHTPKAQSAKDSSTTISPEIGFRKPAKSRHPGMRRTKLATRYVDVFHFPR
jgi:hypothetical protein